MLDRLWDLVDAVALAAFMGMTLLAISQVLFRYVLRVSVPWTEEAARWCFIWQIFLGSVMLTRRKLHISITVIRDRLSPRARRFAEIFYSLLAIIFFGGILLGSIKMLPVAYPLYAGSFNVRLLYLYLSLPISMGLMVAVSLRDIFAQLNT